MTSKEDILTEEKSKEDGFEVENRITFKIYDMPTNVANNLIQRARQESGNKVWVLIKQLLERDVISNRIDDLEQRLKKIEGAADKRALEGEDKHE